MTPSQLWILLHAQIDEMIPSTPHVAPSYSDLLHSLVATSEDGWTLLTRCLFPHNCLCQLIWIKDDGSPTKYSRRRLSWSEISMLWDIPILFMALFGKSSKDLVVLENLLDSPPAKFLELGTDHLLTDYFRDVWVPPAL